MMYICVCVYIYTYILYILHTHTHTHIHTHTHVYRSVGNSVLDYLGGEQEEMRGTALVSLPKLQVSICTFATSKACKLSSGVSICTFLY